MHTISYLLQTVSMLFRFIAAYNDLKTCSPNLNAEELFTSAADILRSSGAVLRPLSEIQKVRSDECLIICAVLIFQCMMWLQSLVGWLNDCNDEVTAWY